MCPKTLNVLDEPDVHLGPLLSLEKPWTDQGALSVQSCVSLEQVVMWSEKSHSSYFFFMPFKKSLFIYFWPHWVFIAARAFL